MSAWVWIERAIIFAVHNEQLAEHGGRAGIRDEGLLESALARPLNLVAYGNPDFADLAAARSWAAAFVRWYNHDHRHSGIRYVSPAQRHTGEDHAILAARHALYLQARALKPARWSGKTRNWDPIGGVTLNPERDCVIKAHLEKVIQPMAA